jgi:hypothetical protein
MITFQLEEAMGRFQTTQKNNLAFFSSRRVFYLFDLSIWSTLNLISCSGRTETIFAEFLIAVRDVTRDVLQNKWTR